MGMVEAASVFEELGAALVPGPLVGSHLAAGLIDGAAEGQIVVGMADAGEPPPFLVEHLEMLDSLWLFDDHALSQVAASDLRVLATPRPVDPLTPMSLVERWPVDRSRVGADTEAVRSAAILLTAAIQAGIARAVLGRAVTYVSQRRQFGVPIGSFQALKHLAADMLVRVEMARVAVQSAAATYDDPVVGSLREAALAAKILADSAATENCAAAIQMFGGMGYTWDQDLHLYLKRSWVHAASFGGSEKQAMDLAVHLITDGRPLATLNDASSGSGDHRPWEGVA
jgi:hypothetical protein